MFQPRLQTVSLLLVSLLTSNVAGWLHVGCCGPESSCGTIQHSVGEAQSSGGATAELSCCCHHHCHGAATASNGPSSDVPNSETPSQDAPSHEHDPDTCSICQNFYLSRHAMAMLAVFVTATIEPTPRGIAPVEDFTLSSIERSGPPVRGPPSAPKHSSV
ncbi:hypothetical protein [Rhodopirellula sallentina]|uniref:hypothetical protein n=1 Tax=Rhodopirellula sallentina TaxID=1263869 RepID=UPI0005C7C0D1|nr:hypothetical protein [Rhodopirellula sallentina]